MQKSFIFAVYDSKLEAYLAPFTCPTAAVAARWLAGLVMTEDHEFRKFAEDYTLFELGEYDAKDASFIIHPTPKAVVKAIALRKDA